MKTLEQIKNEHAKELGFTDFEEMFSEALHTGVDYCVDAICFKYTNQLLKNMTIGIKINQKFIHNDVLYTCVGHDNNKVWGITNEHDEAQPFDFQECNPISEFTLKSKQENPNGLHQRFFIQKIKDGKLTPVDEWAEYFVMRLDEEGSDINHIKSCRIGVHAYADAIELTIPQLAKDLRERYPLL